MTSQSVTGRVWQPSRNRSCTSSWPSCRVSCMVAGDTSPERILHRQLRQRPRAPHVASMPTPAACAASSSEAPRAMRTRRTARASSGAAKPTSIRFDSGIPSGLLEAPSSLQSGHRLREAPPGSAGVPPAWSCGGPPAAGLRSAPAGRTAFSSSTRTINELQPVPHTRTPRGNCRGTNQDGASARRDPV